MTKEEMIILRMNMLGGMDAYIRDVIGDDYTTAKWDMCGVPDGADEEELTAIAEDSVEWCRICALFGNIMMTKRAVNAEIEKE